MLKFKKEIKQEKKKKEKGETPQNCKRAMNRQRFITAIKSVIKKKLRSLIRFHNANKMDNYNRAGRKGGQVGNPKETTEQVTI